MWPFRKGKGLRQRTTILSRFVDKDGQTIGSLILIKNQPILKDYGELVYLTMPYARLPLPSKEDFDRFDEVQARLDDLCEELEFAQPAIVTIDGKRDWILYTKDGNILMRQLIHELSGFELQMECQPDPNWDQYQELRKRLRKK